MKKQKKTSLQKFESARMEGIMEITAEEVQYYLSHPSSLKDLQNQALDIRRQIADLDSRHGSIVSEIYMTAQVSIHYDTIGGSASGKKKDLADLLEVTKNMMEEQREELYLQYQMILEQMERSHRFQLVYHTLPPVSREVLRRLFEENEKWEWIEHDLGMSHRKLVNIRKQALQDMETRFNSALSNWQLAKQRNTCFFSYSKQKNRNVPKSTDIEGQMSIESVITEKEENGK